MKIAAIRNFLTIKAGAQGAFLNMVKSLKSRGHDIDIYVLNISDALKDELSKEFNIISAAFTESRLKGFAYMLDYLRAFPCFKKFARAINKGNYDVAFVDHAYLSPLILPFLSIPKVYFCYEPPRIYYEPYWVHKNISLRIYKLATCIVKFLDAYCVKFADLILCPSDYARESIWKAYGLFAVTNYLGVDLKHYRKLPIDKENMVLTVAVLRPHKGLEFLIRSIGLIPKDKRPKLVVIAAEGSNKERNKLLNCAKIMNVELEILGYVPDEIFIELHSKAKVFAIPYIMEPSVEPVASAFELPIVAVREGGARETIIHNETGILTNRDEFEFAKAIEYLLDNPEIAQNMGRKGRKWIEQNFTWEKCAENLERNFKKAIELHQKIARH